MRIPQAVLVLLLATPGGLPGQTRSMAQDSTLDNLRHPPGVTTVEFGTLGRVRKVGEGPRVMLLIPGIGFSDAVWTEFMEAHRTAYTMYAITLPGFGGTPPLAMPADGASYGELDWTRSAIAAITALMERERIGRATIVAHWALSTQIALSLALEHPDRFDAVVLVAGVLRSYYENVPGMLEWTAEQRVRAADGLGQRWFRTVTRQTWDDNNYMSYDYAVNPRRGLFLWREAQSPSLPVWIRYLLEFYAVDLTPRLAELRVPTLVVQPGFDDPGFYVDDGRNYMRSLCITSWQGAAAANPRLEFVTVGQSRLSVMHDQPGELDRVMQAFLSRQDRRGN